jgi:hypothetical protein
MMIKQEESINRYLEHAMSSAEEQNFLITLAASDDMRMAFRSHLELMKAVRKDKDDLRSVAQVRNRTLAALGLSATAASAFIEQELVRSNKQQAVRHAEVVSGPGPLLTRIGRFIGTQKLALGTGLALGMLTATGVFTSGVFSPSIEAGKHAATRMIDHPSQPVSAPKTVNPAVSTSQPAAQGIGQADETVAPANALHNKDERSSGGHVRHSVMQNTVATSTTPSTSIKSSDIPEVNKVGAATVHTKKAKINKPEESNQAR